MMSSFFLFIEVTASDSSIPEVEFRERLAPCIAYLDALSGAFELKQCASFFYPPDSDCENSTEWSARLAVSIYVGKKRGLHLLDLYKAMVRLIALELPDYKIEADGRRFDYS